MQLLCDENVYTKTIDWLREAGTKVDTVQRLNLRQTPDEDILKYATENKYTIVSRDKDFVNLATLSKQVHYGVIILRIKPGEEDSVHRVLKEVLRKYILRCLKKVENLLEFFRLCCIYYYQDCFSKEYKSLKDKIVMVDVWGYKLERRLK